MHCLAQPLSRVLRETFKKKVKGNQSEGSSKLDEPDKCLKMCNIKTNCQSRSLFRSISEKILQNPNVQY